MITDCHGIQYANLLVALESIRDFDRRYREPYEDKHAIAHIRADLDAIIASASGALAAAGLPADEVRARAMGVGA
jgi:hypothetical protein